MILLLFTELFAFALFAFAWIRAAQFLMEPGGAIYELMPIIRSWHSIYERGEGNPDYQTKLYWFTKPFLGCDVCMSSIHGSYLFFALILTKYSMVLEFWHWPLACMLTAGITIAYNEMNN